MFFCFRPAIKLDITSGNLQPIARNSAGSTRNRRKFFSYFRKYDQNRDVGNTIDYQLCCVLKLKNNINKVGICSILVSGHSFKIFKPSCDCKQIFSFRKQSIGSIAFFRLFALISSKCFARRKMERSNSHPENTQVEQA